jgi:hypothetical protein
MAETDEETQTSPENAELPEPAPEPGVVYFLLKSATRDRTNRTARVAQVGRRAFVQRLAGGTILVRRARPARISEAVLLANIEEIKKAVSEYRIVVTTPAGQAIDLSTLEAAPLGASKPPPNPPLDSAKNDQNQGIGYDVPPTPEGTGRNAETPELLQQRLQEGTEPPPPPSLPPPPDAPIPDAPVPDLLTSSEPEPETTATSAVVEEPPARKHSGKKRGER